MCTLSYLATSEGYILTHNRDELALRPSTEQIQHRKINGVDTYFPQDLHAGGTWFAGQKQKTVCLMNGGSVPHKHEPPYRKSRGLVLLESLEYENAEDFFTAYDFSGIEPFMLFVATGNSLERITHNEQETFLEQMDHRADHIWSATMLYEKPIREKRAEDFWQWRAGHSPDAGAVINFHLRNPGKNQDSYIIERENGLKTVSLTQTVMDQTGSKMYYRDLIQDTEDVRVIE